MKKYMKMKFFKTEEEAKKFAKEVKSDSWGWIEDCETREINWYVEFDEFKKWSVQYNHNDGRSGVVEVITEINKAKAFEYGNGKCGRLTVGEFQQVYDLRYNSSKDLHMAMLRDYFGDGLVKATEKEM